MTPRPPATRGQIATGVGLLVVAGVLGVGLVVHELDDLQAFGHEVRYVLVGDALSFVVFMVLGVEAAFLVCGPLYVRAWREVRAALRRRA